MDDEIWSFQWQINPHTYILCNFCKALEQKHFITACQCRDYNASRTDRDDSGECSSSFQHLANTCVSSATGCWLHLSYHKARQSLTGADSAPLSWASPVKALGLLEDILKPSYLEVDRQSSGEPSKLIANCILCMCHDYQHFGTIQGECGECGDHRRQYLFQKEEQT